MEATVGNGTNTTPLASTDITTILILTSWMINQIIVSGTIFDLKVKSVRR